MKDAILIGRMSSNETVKEIAKHYPILIRSAEFVTKTMKEYLTSNKQDNNLSNAMPSKYYRGGIDQKPSYGVQLYSAQEYMLTTPAKLY